MIQVNLLKNKAVVGAPAEVAKGGESGVLSASSATLDGGFDTFEASPVVQFLKIICMAGFVVSLIAYEKVNVKKNAALVSAKRKEMESFQALKFDKEKDVQKYQGLDKKLSELIVQDQELDDIRKRHLLAIEGVDELQTLTPEDVWLTGVKYREGGSLEVSGQTLLDSGLDRFVVKLKSSLKFKNINVQQDVKKKSQGGRIVNEFRLTMLVSGPIVNETEEEAF